MILGRTYFFILLLIVAISPFLIYKLVWLGGSQSTTGRVSFMGKRYSGVFTDNYPVIQFVANGDTLWFDGDNNLVLEEGTSVPVRFKTDNPADAKIANFRSLWVDTIIYSVAPVVVLLALFLHPLVVPYRSRVRVSLKKPYLQIV